MRPADIVTAVRAAGVAAIGTLFLLPTSDASEFIAMCLAIVVSLLDAVDGWVARRTSSTEFGARFDMETDAALILVLSLLAWRDGKAGAWVILSGAMRYAFVAASAIWPWLDRPLETSRRRQAVCVVQVVGLIVVDSPFFGTPQTTIVAAAALAALTWSFAVDVAWLKAHR